MYMQFSMSRLSCIVVMYCSMYLSLPVTYSQSELLLKKATKLSWEIMVLDSNFVVVVLK